MEQTRNYDAKGNLVSMEILDASRRVSEARSMQFDVAAQESNLL